MIKTYKLIKTYPGCSILGLEVKKRNYGLGDVCYEVVSVDSSFRFSIETIENFPEFWEEVIEKNLLNIISKDWQILSFKNVLTNAIVTFRPNTGKYMITSASDDDFVGASLEQQLWQVNNKFYLIHSVKRLKDNVIFTIGDKINRTGHLKKKESIRFFNITKDNNLVASISDEVDASYFSNNGCNIIAIEHAKIILFTTTDGEDIYEYTDREFAWVIDNVYCYMLFVNEINNMLCLSQPEVYKLFVSEENAEKWIIENVKKPLFVSKDGVEIFEGDLVTWLYRDNRSICCTKKAEKNMYSDLTYFSTKEKAEEYILMDKPCLSINDIKNLSKTDLYVFKNLFYKNIKDDLLNLVKNKI